MVIYKPNMAQKRPSDVQNIYDVSIKHPRLVDSSDQTTTYLDDATSGYSPQEHSYPGEGNVAHDEFESAEKQAYESGFQDTITGLPSSLSLSPWVTSCTSEDDDTAEVGLHLPFSPDYFTFDRPVRSVVHADDTSHLWMGDSPRKRIPIGPAHQADIPECGQESCCDDDNGLCGVCVVPAPEVELPPFNDAKPLWKECSCLDRGSVRCVQQHVIEARKGLRKTLGEAVFLELGFSDMGEVVAEQWTEDEEDLLHEVVYSNPASSGKNFWSSLSAVFPSRTKMEIVSYYFNVFMLRKRAGQNRVHPMNIDSDDDEWEGYENDVYGEGAMTDEDDSAVESPLHHHGHGHFESPSTEHEDTLGDASADEDMDSGYIKHDPTSTYQGLENSHFDDSGSNDSHGTQGTSDGCDDWPRDYVLEPCASKAWDGYMNCLKNKVDLLPTCSMIKEVFGDAFDLQGKSW